ncbi:MAG TPA: orotate phosphoribosyltransferase [Pyrinomonadaceae bacterium]
MKAEAVLERFKATGALLEGHFILTSGLHSEKYLQCALVLQYPEQAEEFGRAIADQFRDQKIALVASPAIGGIVIGHEVARALGARFLWTERDNGVMTLRRGFSVQRGERTLVVEDVVTTGGSTRETVDVLRGFGAEVVAAASIVDRSAGGADVGVLRVSLMSLDVPAVDPNECELCRSGVPAIKPGSRKIADAR